MTRSHNTRDVDLGKPEAGLSLRDVERFWSKVPNRPSGGACWLWAANLTGSLGYGQFVYQVDIGQSCHVYAHRIAYALSHGPVPDGLEILHGCHTPACVNPDHLSAGTHTENVRDSARAGRLHAPRPKRQKLSDDTCEVILARVASGELQNALAREYGVSKTAISLLCSGQRRQYRRTVAVPALRKAS